jgi:nucleoside 2-deoxyribosyltransferase
MNVYFAASIRAGRDLQPTYERVVQHLKDAEHTILSEQVASRTVEADERHRRDREIYRRDIAQLDRCDVVVAEVTTPSLGVGYEIAYALHHLDRPVVCLCRTGENLSAMLMGNDHPRLQVIFYDDLNGGLAELDRVLSAVSS